MIKEAVWDRVREAYTTTPMYMEMLEEDELKRILQNREWKDIPVMTKNRVINRQSGNVSAGYVANRELIRTVTSGSTGKYLEVLWDRGDYSRSLIELWRRRASYYDVYPNDRLLYFYTVNENNKKITERDHELGISKMLLNQTGLDKVYDIILEWNPEWMLLQPSSAVILCQYIRQNKRKIPDALKYIEFSGELLTPEVRKMAEETFACRCANQYGANETGTIAYECPQHNMHVMSTNVYVESRMRTVLWRTLKGEYYLHHSLIM